MKKYAYLSIFVMCVFFSCNMEDADVDYRKRIIVKTIKFNKDTEIECFHYSLITGNSPDNIEFKTGNKRQLIAKSNTVCDIFLRQDTLIILAEDENFIELNTTNSFGIQVRIDSSCKGKYLYIK